MGRLVQLQGLEGAKYRAAAQRERVQQVRIPAERGSITTADGVTLAMTVETDTVFADPPQITGATARATSTLRHRVATALAGPLHLPAGTLLHLLDHPSSPDYVVLAAGVPATTGAHIESLMSSLKVTGIYLTRSYARDYPGGDLASNLVGFTNVTKQGDLVGEAGIEQFYNRLLAGRDGREEVETGTSGQPIPVGPDRVRPMVAGSSIRLTILSSLQWEAQQACAAEVRKTEADNCTVVVMQPSTGKILALAQSPGYDPAHVADLASTVDLPVSAWITPGSTAKVITVAAALEHGGQTLASAYTVPGRIMINGQGPFQDADPHPTERLTVAGVLAHSSNVGMVQVAGHVSPQTQYDYYRKFGVAAASEPALPGASAGFLRPPSKWQPDERYVLAFGQGVEATAVQMAGVYATIANGGVRVDPSVVAGTTGPHGRFVASPASRRQRVIKSSTAHQLISVLQQVPYLDATRAAQPWGMIPGYSIAAKTGTSQEWSSKAHCLCLYGASYIGMAPASDPQVVVAVNVQHPRRGGYYGNAVAGPVFYHVMRSALQALKIPPDGAKRPSVPLTAR